MNFGVFEASFIAELAILLHNICAVRNLPVPLTLVKYL